MWAFSMDILFRTARSLSHLVLRHFVCTSFPYACFWNCRSAEPERARISPMSINSHRTQQQCIFWQRLVSFACVWCSVVFFLFWYAVVHRPMIIVMSSETSLVSSSLFQRSSMTSHRSADSESGGPTKQTFTKTALYKVNLLLWSDQEGRVCSLSDQSSVVALKRFHKIKLEITRALQLEVKTVEWTGVVWTTNTRCDFAVHLDARSHARSHRSIHWDLRGSQASVHRHRILSERQFTGEDERTFLSIATSSLLSQDILENEEIRLDTMFKHSIMHDIAKVRDTSFPLELNLKLVLLVWRGCNTSTIAK